MSGYAIAKYIRLSLDDALTDSLSIPHQRLLLDGYIEELGLPNTEILEFVDNGYTGTNTERPGFKEMIELVRCGKINCIVTKDFSRFARNELESGYYIEQVFPLYRVRFIAIGDNFDSANYADGTGGIDVAFKFLMHEFHSKDLSKKVRSAKRALMERGEHIVAGAVHGYRKNSMGKWEPDPDAAEAVKLIFRLALEGLPVAGIRDRLFEAKFPSPREYSLIKRGKDIVSRHIWPMETINSILRNEQYIGSYVAGKCWSTHVGTRKRTHYDKSEWIVNPDSHPALVSKEAFARVQNILDNPREQASPEISSRCSELRERTACGKLKPRIIPYGYIKGDGGVWEVDGNAAAVIKEIYEMVLAGLPVHSICEKLSENGYPTPSEQFRLNKGRDFVPSCRWKHHAVLGIIRNEQYTGVYVDGKSFQINGKKRRVPKNEWIRIPDRHPAIIGSDVFEQVQAICGEGRKNMVRREYLLSGKTACGCCGFALSYYANGATKVYRCAKSHADPTAKCHKMKADANVIENAVMGIITKQAESVLAFNSLADLRKADIGEQCADLLEIRAKQLAEQRQQCYEQFLNQEIDRETFQTLKAGFTSQIEGLNNQFALIRQMEKSKDARKKTSALAKNALSGTATPKEIVNALVDRVLVFPNNHIEIHWKFESFAEGM